MKELIKKYEEDLKVLAQRLEDNIGKPSELLIAEKIDMLESIIKDLKSIK